MEDDQKEYEVYMKGLVDKFSELCSVKWDYQDWSNWIIEKDMDTRYSFYPPHERVLIDMMLDKSFENDGVRDKILQRQEMAKRWLSENLLSYDEWKVKNKDR
jgi:hypothetical protein